MAKKILVIDDDVDARNVMKHTLEKNGFAVELKASASTGLAYFQEKRDEVALVIIDVLMPRMMGPELAQRLITLQPQVQLLFTSAYSIEILDPATQASYPLLTKPLKPADVIEKVSELVGEDTPLRSNAKSASR